MTNSSKKLKPARKKTSRTKGKQSITNVSQVIQGNQIEKQLKLSLQYYFIKKNYSVFLEKSIVPNMSVPDLAKVDDNLAQLAYDSSASKYRADVLAINTKGEVIVVEIKSSKRDYSTDHKFLNYRYFCDKLYLAVTDDWLTSEMIADIPKEVGIIHIALDKKNQPVFKFLRNGRRLKLLQSGTRFALMVNLAWHSGLSKKQVLARKPVFS